MTDAEVMLHAVLADPDEDLHRLVYADAIEDEQPERAEFIRIQLRLAKLCDQGCHETDSCNITGRCDECHRDVEAEPFRIRERELLRSQVQDPRAGYPLQCSLELAIRWPMIRVAELRSLGDYEIRRGFIETIQLSWDDWIDRYKEILATNPIKTIRLTSPVVFDRLDLTADGVDYRFVGGTNQQMTIYGLDRIAGHRLGEEILEKTWPGLTFIIDAPMWCRALSTVHVYSAIWQEFRSMEFYAPDAGMQIHWEVAHDLYGNLTNG